ncbi:ATP-binding protein [Sutcliffiella horikoshii]|uniref:ATP-binding protein n=1 Tax=Sutcliffiella horikoshii TaxID=79883 RepID=UPI00384E98BD
MKEIKGILSINDVYKKAVLKIFPELEGESIETDFKTGIACPGCGESGNKGTDGLFFRVNKSGEWIQLGETLKCSNCRNAEALNAYMENSLREREKEIADRLTKEYFLIPEKLNNSGFKDYRQTNKVTTRAKENVIRFIKDFFDSSLNNYNLLIMGNPGTGKTHLCVAAARTLKEKSFKVGFLTTGQLLTKIKSTFNKASMKTVEEILHDLKKLDVLVLDDIGSEAISGNDDWRKAMIFEVVESRSGKPTIYTSNLTETDLLVAVGPRVFSRLYDNTKFIDLFTDDYRKRLQIE